MDSIIRTSSLAAMAALGTSTCADVSQRLNECIITCCCSRHEHASIVFFAPTFR